MANLWSFDAQTETPQMLQERRLRALMAARGIGRGATVGGGAGDLLTGLAAAFANYKNDQAEQAGNKYGNDAFSTLMQTLSQPRGGVPGPSNPDILSGVQGAIASGGLPPLATYTPPGANPGPGASPQPPAPHPGVDAELQYDPNQPPPNMNIQPGPMPPPPGLTAGPMPGVMPQPMSPAPQPYLDPQPTPVADIPQPAPPIPTIQPHAPMAAASNDLALLPKIAAVLANPWVPDAQKELLRKRYDEIQQQSDPQYQLEQKNKNAMSAFALTEAQQTIAKNKIELELAAHPHRQVKVVGNSILSVSPDGQDYKVLWTNPNGSSSDETSAIKDYKFAQTHPEFAFAQKWGKPPPNFRWGPADKDGNPSLVPLEGGNASPGDMSDPAYKDYITRIANNKMKPPSAGRNPLVRAKTMQDILSVNPQYDETKYEARQKQANNFANGPLGNITRSLGVGVAHLGTLGELGDALANGDVQMINAAKQSWARQFGADAPVSFDAAKSIVADEIAKGVIGGQTAQSDRETLAAAVKNSSSPEQLKGVITTFQKLMAGQLAGIKQQYLSANPGATDFEETFFQPDVASILEQFNHEPAAGGGGSGDHWAVVDGKVVLVKGK